METPRHITFHLTHNQHKCYYETIEDYTRDAGNPWVNEEQKERALKEDSVWEAQWYPDTPVGHYRVMGADLDVVLKYAQTVQNEEDTSRADREET